MTTRWIVASGNRHKVAEIRRALAELDPDLDVLGLDRFPGIPFVPETADTFAGNAALKAQGIATWLRERGEPEDTVVLADDSGLCVDALAGGPGVRSARFAGDQATDADNNRKLVEVLRGLGRTSSPAHYVCVLAWLTVGGQGPRFFEGRWDVEVRLEPRGQGGFGYDPYAWLPGRDLTVAELAPEDKARDSHRGRALAALLAALRSPA